MTEQKHKHAKPPELPRKILSSFIRKDLAEEVEGDLEEKFFEMRRRRSLWRARIGYWYEVLHYLRPFAIRRKRSRYVNHISMFRSYFNIGVRNLVRDKGFSMINIGGLAVGMAVAILIGLWVYDELSFNHFHLNKERIGRVMRNGTLNGVTGTTNYQSYPLAEELRDKYGSSFRHVLRVWPAGDHIISVGEEKMTKQGSFIEPGGPEMFSFRMQRGTWSALNDTQSIIISSSLSGVLFGDEDPIGKSLMIDTQMEVTVTGVYEDLPHNTHFAGVDFFAPWDLLERYNQWMLDQGFGNNFLDIYVEIQPTVTFEQVSEQIAKAVYNNIDDEGYRAVNPEIFLHPMEKWHLFSEWENGVNTGGLIEFVWLFGIIGVFVMSLACINFVNLTTARSERRAREVGIRKTIGSMRNQLIAQFFTESFAVVIVAFAGALALAWLSMDWFNDFSGKKVVMPLGVSEFWVISTLFILFTSLLAGGYPAFYLSSFQPVKVLKGGIRAGRLSSLPRKILVVIQFTVSVTLVIGTGVVYKQIQFAKDRPVGYAREGLVMIPLNSPEYQTKLDAIEIELKNSGVVDEVARSLSPATGVWSTNGGFEWRGMPPALQSEFATLDVSHDYGKTVGWEFVQGRDFSIEYAGDSTGFILNETAAALMGFENAVGEQITWNPGWREGATWEVIGVIKDMIMRSPYQPSMPTVFFIGDRLNWLNIKLKSDTKMSEAVPVIASVFKEIIPAVPFDYKLADEEYETKFSAEERIGKLAAVFAGLAVFISCLGLFGLSSFVASRRIREIGIRKVFGATVFNLWKLLSRDFVILVIVSGAISIPIGWYVLSGWLQRFSYRTDMPWWIFAGAMGGALLITISTVSIQAIRAALMNPVKSLRTE